ncbi:MAG: hypothetical protein H7122_12105 [Chitinophagaceae bacterium]|nr:hypothetical protein [Chitinophagaceae bacterium]
MKFNILIHSLLRPLLPVCAGVSCFISGSHTQAQDSVIVAASTKYINCSPVRVLFIGKNYRREWSTPVKMPVFHLKKHQGGFKIKELGGGQQTKSLRLLDKNGQEWVLRSTDKDVAKAMEVAIKNKFVSRMVKNPVQDLISASHPYGSLTVSDLARAAGVIVARPKLFFVPDDPDFGEYRSLFANTVCFLEDREPTPDQSEPESTEDVMEKVFKKNDHQLLQQNVLRARLLDMLIADWDRHQDQWKWGVQKKGETTYYYPIPKDRDFAYFKSNGLLVLFASMTVLPHMHSFTNDGSALKKLSNKTWEMDAQWLNQLDEKDWKNAIIQFQNKLTDSVIEMAVKKIPAEVYAISGKKLERKLKNRRNGLLEHAMNYYRFLATNAFIIGSDEQEFFTIEKAGDNITVTASRNGSEDKNKIIYQRTFNQRHTKKIVIMGLDGNDHFDINENVSSSIKLQLEGGDGNDVYSVKGKIKTKIEDDHNSPAKIVLAQK